MAGRRSRLFAVGVALVLAGCGGAADEDVLVTTTAGAATTTTARAATTTIAGTTSSPPGTTSDGCADVVAGSIEWSGDTATVSATVRSADTGWDKYADRWEVRTGDGVVLGERILTHPHETEQPFTRTLAGVDIPGDVDSVTIAAHDSVAGWCGQTLTIDVPPAP